MSDLKYKNKPKDVLNEVFGYKEFRGCQQEIIENILDGNDALVLMPTGGGKSLCFQIPALCLDGVAIVVSPLISLMQDQVNTLKSLGVKAEFLNSTLSPNEEQNIVNLMLENRIDLVYVSPERLNKKSFLEALDNTKISLFAIDEAHCVSQWGHNFRPEYTQFYMLEERFPGVARVALTATADELTRKDIIKNLHMENCKIFLTSFDRPNIHYSINIKNNEKEQLLDFINTKHPNDSGIVYCISRKRVEMFTRFLKEEGFKAYPYHAGLNKETRERNQDIFINEENIIMVATIAFGMGIDKPDVRFVAHLDLPKSIESYYQQTGRAGRDGIESDAWLIYGLSDIVQLKSFINESRSEETQKRIEIQKLNALLAFVETADCRRKVLLEYFNENYYYKCQNCDTCISPPQTYDATIDAQKVLSCIIRINHNGVAFGMGHIINILQGVETVKIQRFYHYELSTFGIGKNTEAFQWQSIIRQLVILGYIVVDPVHLSLRLSPKANRVLKGRMKIHLRKEFLKSTEKYKKNKVKKLKSADFSSDDDFLLFDKLKTLRLNFAKEENMPPYVIFHDKTLIEMVLLKPKTIFEMEKISGVGKHKLKKFGQDFLNIINS